MAKHNKAFVLLRFLDDKLTSVWCKPLHYIYCSVPQKYDKNGILPPPRPYQRMASIK